MAMVPRYVNSWLVGYREVPAAELRLFCFPFAGGGARVFHNWPQHLPENMEVLSVQLPGRGSRRGEPVLDDWGDLLGSLATALEGFLDKPFAFFGHSFGALFAFEMTRYLRRHGQPIPRGLFVSGCGAPQFTCPPSDPIHVLPNPELIERVQKWGGVPKEILHYSEALSLFIPPLRGDLKLLETYHYSEEEPLSIPIEAFGGCEDPEVAEWTLKEWKFQTQDRFNLTMVEGDHFFIEKHPEVLWQSLNDWFGFNFAYNSFW